MKKIALFFIFICHFVVVLAQDSVHFEKFELKKTFFASKNKKNAQANFSFVFYFPTKSGSALQSLQNVAKNFFFGKKSESLTDFKKIFDK